jgi:putative radical SAM enzyme (TIGR03279 family)
VKNSSGVEIEEIQKGSIAEKAGLRAGDRLIAVNGHEVRDEIDLMFYSNEPKLKLFVLRNKEKVTINADIDETARSGIGIVLKPFKIKTCRNNCIFCFVAQLPRGLRRPLYIKDEDYRMSFLYGNYITMTNLSDADKKRIVEQRLSPLYISVHSTNTEIRNKLIGNPHASDILREIKFLASHKIRMHTQIVLCPGYNDGKNLEKTITDLYKYYPYVASIAVAPVGLTVHRKRAIRPVEKDDAVKAIETIQKLQTRFRRKHGDNIVYAADELYIKAEMQFPPLEHYGELPQIENGVGMVPVFLHQAKRIKAPCASKKKMFVTFTGVSFYPYLSRLIDRLIKDGIGIEAISVENAFFGQSVTVTGLLTGRDVIKSLSGIVKKDDVLLIPDVVMREGDEVFLDGVSRQDIEDVLGVKAVVIESTPKGLADAIAALSS